VQHVLYCIVLQPTAACARNCWQQCQQACICTLQRIRLKLSTQILLVLRLCSVTYSLPRTFLNNQPICCLARSTAAWQRSWEVGPLPCNTTCSRLGHVCYTACDSSLAAAATCCLTQTLAYMNVAHWWSHNAALAPRSGRS
jgi:hypothetical protein